MNEATTAQQPRGHEGDLRPPASSSAEPEKPRVFVAALNEERERRVVLAARMSEALQGVTCATIAERTGWGTETIRRYLQGKTSPPATILMVLAERFGINPDFLLLGRGPAQLDRFKSQPREVSKRQLVDSLYYLISQLEGTSEE
jgi:transcriptional regulator with XRE-family HTH domain